MNAAGTAGTTAAVGTSSVDHWGSVWVSAIATKSGSADSDVVRSARYLLRRIVTSPDFEPDGGTHDAHMRSIAVELTSDSELASIRYSVNGAAPSCGASWGTCSELLLNNCGGYCSKDVMVGPANLNAEQAVTLRAIAYRDGWANSDVATSSSYTVKRIVARPDFTPNGGSFANSPISVAISSTSGATITYTTAQGEEAAVYPSTVGSTYSSAISLTSTMGQTSVAVAGTSGVTNVTAIASKAGWADSDVFANVFVVSEVLQWSSSNGVSVCSAALDFIKSGVNCHDVLKCKGTTSTDTTVRVATLELATGECVCK